MSHPHVTYVNDHLGGAQVAVRLLEAMRDQHDDQEFRQFASVLLPEIQADDGVLTCIAEKIGSGPSSIKQMGGWFLEKAARLKLGHTGSAGFELFESLELLALGIQGSLHPVLPGPPLQTVKLDLMPDFEVGQGSEHNLQLRQESV